VNSEAQAIPLSEQLDYPILKQTDGGVALIAAPT
jgi:hypothetical protein